MSDTDAMDDPFARMINENVVLDTATPILYIGTLKGVTPHSFVLRDVDMHDCRDGHASKEEYVAAAQRDGVTPNRRNIVVMKAAVFSVSLLADIDSS